MADKYINEAGLLAIRNYLLQTFAEASDLTALEGEVDTLAQEVAQIIAEGGEPNVVEIIKRNGTALTPDASKAVDVIVPTAVSDLTNDSGFQTDTDVSGSISDALANSGDAYQTASAVDAKIAAAMTAAMTYKGSVATVADLPASGNKVGDFYNVLADGRNYAWDGNAWDDAGGSVDTSTLWSSTPGQSNSLIAMTVSEINEILNS